MTSSRMRVPIAVLLLGEAGLSAVRVSGLLPLLAVYDWPVLAMAGLRAAVASAQCAAGFMWLGRRTPAPAFTRGALLASALLLSLEIGAGLLPTSVFPAFRWPIVGAYWVYVLVVILVVQSRPSTAQKEASLAGEHDA